LSVDIDNNLIICSGLPRRFFLKLKKSANNSKYKFYTPSDGVPAEAHCYHLLLL